MMVHGPHSDLREIAAAAWVVAPDRYILRAIERRVVLSGQAEGASAPDVLAIGAPPQAILLQMLESELYYQMYRRPGDPLPSDPANAEVDAMRSYTAALSAANCGSGTWDPGWVIEAVAADGSVLARRDEVTYRALPAEVRAIGSADDPNCAWRNGMRVRVRVPSEMRQLVPAFYMALGNADWPDPPDGGGPLVRFYWALSSAIAPRYLREITGILNELRVPFRTKVVQDPSQYRNADAGVLYVPFEELGSVWPAIEATHKAIEAGLRSVVPMFTRSIAAGLGMAEDPGAGLSFGQSRCRIAASGLWAAFEAGAEDTEERLQHIAAAFLKNDIDPAQPHRRRAARIEEPIFASRRARNNCASSPLPVGH